jgi:hypothetical protein
MMPMQDDSIPTRRWTRTEYERLGELGILPEDEPVELIGGQRIVRYIVGELNSPPIVTSAHGPAWASHEKPMWALSACWSRKRRWMG